MLYVARACGAGEEEVELHVNLAELLGFLFKTHGQAFLPAFEELLLPSVLEMATPESLPEDRKVPLMVVVCGCCSCFFRGVEETIIVIIAFQGRFGSVQQCSTIQYRSFATVFHWCGEAGKCGRTRIDWCIIDRFETRCGPQKEINSTGR